MKNTIAFGLLVLCHIQLHAIGDAPWPLAFMVLILSLIYALDLFRETFGP